MRKISQAVMLFVLSVLTISAFSPQTSHAFDENHRRYLHYHDVFRVLRQKFPRIEINGLNFARSDSAGNRYYQIDDNVFFEHVRIYDTCLRVSRNSKAFLGVPSPSTGEAVFISPSPAFVKWYSSCLSQYIDANLVYYRNITSRTEDPVRGYFKDVLGQAVVDKLGAVLGSRDVISETKSIVARDRELLDRMEREFLVSLRWTRFTDVFETLKSAAAQPKIGRFDYYYFGEGQVETGFLPMLMHDAASKGAFESKAHQERFIKHLKLLKTEIGRFEKRGFRNTKGTQEFYLPFNERHYSQKEFYNLLIEFEKRLANRKDDYFKANLERFKRDRQNRTALDSKVKFTEISWLEIPSTIRTDVIRALVHYYIGPGVHQKEDVLVEALGRVVEKFASDNKATILEIVKKLTFLICSEEEFLTY